MTSFGYWANRVPHGQFLCCLCFEAYLLEHASTDEDGDRCDVCIACAEQERAS